jgi:hypothetical protein
LARKAAARSAAAPNARWKAEIDIARSLVVAAWNDRLRVGKNGYAPRRPA